MAGSVLRIARPAWEAAWAGVKRAAPWEAVGALVGRDCAEEAVFLPNVAEDPRVAYRADPKALLRLLRRLDEENKKLFAFFHSHPEGLAYPSARDREEARWPVPYLIFGLAEGRARAFRLPSGEEVRVEVVER